MIRFVRVLMRLVLTVLSISAVVFLVAGGFWYAWRSAQGHTPAVGARFELDDIATAGLGAYLSMRQEEIDTPADAQDDSEVIFEVEDGEAAIYIGYRLENEGLISDAELFRRLVQYEGVEGALQRGTYRLQRSMTLEEIIEELQHGRVPTIAVTVVEGWRAEEIGAELERLGLVSSSEFMRVVIAGNAQYAFLRDRPEGSSRSLEGFLYPDTYSIPENAGPEQIVDMMLQNWDDQVPDDLRAKAVDGDLTLYEAVTLASIVEREAVVAHERPMIAGVYLNRLEQGMYLQSDPTVQYAKGYDEETGRWWNPMLQEEAITVTSPYNTFLNPGIPPSPICNPRLESIQGVLEPAEHDYLFFYHRGDGSHAFAETYEQHLQNEQLYGGQ